MNLKVCTLNTWLVAKGPDWLYRHSWDLKERAVKIGKWLSTVDPDIVLLQEVLREKELQLILSQFEIGHSHHHPSSGLAILSKFKIENQQFFPFRWQGNYISDAKRLAVGWINGLLACEANLDGQTLAVCVTHPLARYPQLEGFDQPSDKITPERKANLLEIADFLKKYSANHPLLFGGDLNMNQRSSEYLFFADLVKMQDTLKTFCEKKGLDWYALSTYCAENPYIIAQKNCEEGILDHIMTTSGFEVLDAAIAKEADAFSDHRAVVVTLSMEPSPLPFQARRPNSAEKNELIEYFRGIKIHPLTLLSPAYGWRQRKKIIELIGAA